MDKASQPAHCPYVLHGGRYRSLPLSRVFDVRICTVLCALAAQTHLRAFTDRRASPSAWRDDYRKYRIFSRQYYYVSKKKVSIIRGRI